MRKGLEEPLGATEFAATLNGDNPNAILHVLKRFAKQVRNERRLALFSREGENDNLDLFSEDSDDELSDIGDSNDLLPPTKRLKKSEGWKEDTADYHVPFVGTAVSRGDIAEVVTDQWPTGLLKTYLAKSPLAIELTGDDWIPSTTSSIHKSLLRRKQNKLSQAIFKSYLKAVTELVTASVSISQLKQEELGDYGAGDRIFVESDENPNFPFLSALLKKRLVGIIHLLADGTDKGRGKSTVYGGCGPMVPLALQFLRSIAQTSISNARLVCRFLDEELVEGVLKAILRPPPPLRKEEGSDKVHNTKTKPARLEAIRLATTLLRTADSAVATYICTGGSKERKIKPGILYVAFREGLAKHSQAQNLNELEDSDDYFSAVADMLNLATAQLQETSRSKSAGQNLMRELLARDPMYHICDLSLFAPILTSELTFEHILSENVHIPIFDQDSSKSIAGRQAQILLFLLLADSKKSPQLNNLVSADQRHLMVNVMLRLLQSGAAGMQIRRFILHCLQSSPVLFPEFLRAITIPEPSKSYGFISMIRFVSMLLDEGPSTLMCKHAQICLSDEEATVEFLLSTIWPQKLKRQAIGKAMQNENPLVVLECIKLTRKALKRFWNIKQSINEPGNVLYEMEESELATRFAQILPGLQVVLAVRSKYFLSPSRGSTLMCHGIHVLLQDYVSILPLEAQSSSFDWIKLLPNASAINEMSVILQRKMLSCYSALLSTHLDTSNNIMSSLKVILEIMLQTSDTRVYSQCRQIASLLLHSVVGIKSESAEKSAHLQIEIQWWLDAVTVDSLPSFFELVVSCHTKPLEILSQGGTRSQQLDCSILTVGALSSATGCHSFSKMVVQIIFRSLLFHQNPIAFSSFFIASRLLLNASTFPSENGISSLLAYGRALVQLQEPSHGYVEALTVLVKAVTCESSFYWQAFSCPTLPCEGQEYGNMLEADISFLEIARFYIHLCRVFAGRTSEVSRCQSLTCQIIPSLVMFRKSVLSDQTIKEIQELSSVDFGSAVDVLLLSYPGCLDMNDFADSHKTFNLKIRSSRACITRLYLLGTRQGHQNEILNSQLRILEENKSEREVAAKTALTLGSSSNASQQSLSFAEYEISTLEKVFQYWWSPVEMFCKPLIDDLHSYFGTIIAAVLTSPSLQSVHMLKLLSEQDNDRIITKCLEKCNQELTIGSSVGMIDALIYIEPLRYSPHLLSNFESLGLYTSSFWMKGYFDRPMKRLLGHLLSSDENAPQAIKLESAIFSRAIAAIDSMQQVPQEFLPSQRVTVLDTAITIVLYGKVDTEAFIDLRQTVGSFLTLILNKGYSNQLEAESVCRLGIALVQRDKERKCLELRSSVFWVLAKKLLTLQKKKSSSDSGTCNLNSIEILKFLKEELEKNDMDKDYIWSRSTHLLLGKLIRSLLKHGIHDGLDSSTIERSEQSLNLLCLLLFCGSKGTTLKGTLDPEELFSMATSHSKFQFMLTRKHGKEDQNHNDQVQLIDFMLVCIQLSQNPGMMNARLWKLTHTVFSGGLGRLDTAIRRLHTFCSNFQNAQIFKDGPFLDEIRWSTCVHLMQNESVRWDWLVEAIDAGRIRETIKTFPLHDSVDVLANNTFDKDDKMVIGDSDSDSNSESYASSGREEISTSKSVRAQHCPNYEYVNEVAHAFDGRYSPGFILPLVLAALNSFPGRRPAIEREINSVDSDAEVSIRLPVITARLVQVCKRLCEKGIHALCLASLASKCEKIRSYSVSIMGVLIDVCNSEEARGLSSWRDRPQLAMLLNSVQRGLVIERAKNFTSTEKIPKLSSLVSTFLESSSLSIAKPDDPMYVSLNRYYLKSDNFHGAFQDMNRLPAFIALFCSSNDDPSQSRKERLWAMNLVKDGFLDASSYRLLSSCHAPELLLTSFENVRFTGFSSEMKSSEYVVLFETLNTMIVRGGHWAASHLIDKIGLLSWLSNICFAEEVSITFPVVHSRIALLKLIGATANTILTYTHLLRPTTIDEYTGLTSSVIELGICTDTPSLKLEAVKEAVKTLSCICMVFQRFYGNFANEIEPKFIHPVGIDLFESMTLLNTCPTDLKQHCLSSLCYLPFRIGNRESQSKGASDFCLLSLEVYSDGSQSSDKIFPISMLQRVILIADHFGSHFPEKDSLDMTRILLSSRAKYQTTEELGLLWIECLEILSLRLKEDTFEARLAADVLNQI